MKRLIGATFATALLLSLTTALATANGVSPEKLERAGWFCFEANSIIHCLPHGEPVLVTGEANTSLIMAFDPQNDDEFLGTELLVHADLYKGQPCPQDEVAGGDGSYIDLRPDLPYFVCHHFDSPVT